MRSYKPFTSFKPLLLGSLVCPLVFPLVLPLTGCDGTRGDTTSDAVPTASAKSDKEESAALKAEMESPNDPKDTANSIYFRARADENGGIYVTRVNRLLTTCADGQVLPECPVAQLDTTQLQIDQAADAELRAHLDLFLLRGTIAGSPSTWGIFRATEAWQGHPGTTAIGTYMRATSTDIVCITYPCMSYLAARLNSDQPPESVAGVNLDRIGNGGRDGYTQLHTPEGVLVAAELTSVTGPAGTANALDATEYYLPFNVARGAACGARGLPDCAAGQFCKYEESAHCGRADAPGVCTVAPQACTLEENPVCGCDGQTYSNACRAFTANTSVDHAGACNL